MHRFFIDSKIENNLIFITGSDYNHITRSLRLNLKDKIIVSTGDGWDYLVELSSFDNMQVKGKVIKKEKNENEAKVKITLAQGIPKKSKFDFIVEKASEIGVKKIIPLITKRTIVKLDHKKRLIRQQRWQKISRETAKQARRGVIPEITPVLSLKDLAKIKDEYDLILIAWEEEKNRGLRDIMDKLEKDKIQKVLVLIGPEGGFSSEEVKFILKLGGQVITLGPRILKTDTAALVLLTMILYEVQELGG